MSSDRDESIEHLDDQITQPDVTKMDTLPFKKEAGVNEHAKPKRRRRGKKRKHRKESAATCENENHDECESEQHVECEHENHVDCESPTWDSDEDLSCDINSFTDVIIRPVNVPKAPENSTQFIMDDHNECRLYMSFETPNPYLADPPNFEGKDCVLTEPDFEDAAYRDIDYEYESPQDFDNSAYYDREFELSYKSNRFDELLQLSRAKLISAYQNLESRLKELSDELVKENPSPILEKLQAKLLELQEKHSFLKECNSKLTSLVLQNKSVCSVNDLEDLTESMPISHEEPVFHISDSDKELCQEDTDLCIDTVPEHLNNEHVSGSDSDIQNVGINFSSCGESCDETNDIDGRLCPQLVSEEEPTQSTTADSSCEQIVLNDSNSHDNYNTEVSHCTVEVCAELKVHDNSDGLHVNKQAKCSAIEAP